ncbi:MAG: hypothetical protein ACFB4J_14665, partial [Elainellaceae cyanobacterium]
TGQTITLSRQLEVSPGKRIVIDGGNAPGLTLSGNGRHRILQVNSNQDFPTSLTLRNLTLANGYTAERGGAVQVEHRGELTVQNVGFASNVADDGGGAIHNAFETRLTVIGSTFTGNRATAGNSERGGGAIAFRSTDVLVIEDSAFIGNQGINGGAINSLQGQLTIENSVFRNNSTTAARFATGQARPFLRGFGGALYADRASSGSNATSGTIRISGSTFEGNEGRGEGGAAYLFTGTQDQVMVDNSRFVDNSVIALPNGGNGGNGGAIVQLSDDSSRGFTINNTVFTGNTAANQGGGVWTSNVPTAITNSTFSSNRSLGFLGGGLALFGPTDIARSTFADNRAGSEGGAIGVGRRAEGQVTVSDTIFFNNTNDSGAQQHSNIQLVDSGNNFQFPGTQANRVTDVIRTDVDPQLMPRADGTFAVGNPAVLAGAMTIPDGFSPPEEEDILPESEMTPDPGPRNQRGTNGRDVLTGDGRDNRLVGRGGSDRLIGRAGEDTLIGGSGNDRLVGGNNSDRLLGGRGNDRLVGGRGDDFLRGDRGNDTLIGGGGADIFALRAGQGRDRINRFQNGQDRIRLLGSLSFSDLEITRRGNGVLLSFDGEDLAQITGVRVNQIDRQDFI